MSKNSKAKRDKKKALKLKEDRAKNAQRIKLDSPEIVFSELEKLFNPSLLTTPSDINADLLNFCAGISDQGPFFIDSEPESWSRQNCCDLNVIEYIKIHGGNIVFGYRLWYHAPRYIEAERHAIWHKDGEFNDVSFSSDGEVRCLFVPDKLERQGSLESNVARIRWGKDHVTKELISIHERMESRRRIKKLSDKDAWATMPTYDEWLAGKKMPALIPFRNG